jgi:membrane-bound serine protease (ClpP class)
MSSLLPAVRRPLLAVFLGLLVATLVAVPARAQVGDGGDLEDASQIVDILPIEGLIDPPVANQIIDVIDSANARGSALVVLQLDSPGVVSADVGALLDAIRASGVPVAVYVGPRAAGAQAAGGGLFVVAAGHIRAAAVDATLGPAAPVDLGDDDVDPDAVVDELVRLWPALADSSVGRVPLATSALVAEEAAPVLDVLANGLEPLLVELDGVTVTTSAGEQTLRIRRDEVGVRFHSLGLMRRMLHAATTPAFIYLLFVIGLALLLFEVFQPGFGVAGVAGIVMAAIGVFGLTVLPVAWWAVALVVLGLGLFGVDTAVAGLGPVTGAATAAFGVGSWWLYDSPVIGLPTWLVVATTLSAVVFFVLVMTVVLRAQAGPDDLAVEDLVGRPGIVRSVLNPEGHVYIDGALWRARWTGEAKRAKVGTPVTVHGVDGPVVLVHHVDQAAPGVRNGERGRGREQASEV